jgi:hypothetical protein
MVNVDNACKQLRQPLLMKWVEYIPQKIEMGKRQSPEETVKSLQGVFCKGRYQSWILSQRAVSSRTSKKPGVKKN